MLGPCYECLYIQHTFLLLCCTLYCYSVSFEIPFTYLAPKKLVRLSEVTDGGLDMLSFPNEGGLLRKVNEGPPFSDFHLKKPEQMFLSFITADHVFTRYHLW